MPIASRDPVIAGKSRPSLPFMAVLSSHRAFLSDVLPAFKASNPQLQIEQLNKRHRHPKAIGFYREFLMLSFLTARGGSMGHGRLRAHGMLVR